MNIKPNRTTATAASTLFLMLGAGLAYAQTTPLSTTPTPIPDTTITTTTVTTSPVMPAVGPDDNTSTLFVIPTEKMYTDQMNATMDADDGPVYQGAPDYSAASALFNAGGTPWDFSIKTALGNMGGPDFADREIARLTHMYGPQRVGQWEDTFHFVVLDAYLQGKKNGVNFPQTSDRGAFLASDINGWGSDTNGDFHTGYLFDRILSHDMRTQIRAAVNAKYGDGSWVDFRTITDQAIADAYHGYRYGDHGFDSQYNNATSNLGPQNFPFRRGDFTPTNR